MIYIVLCSCCILICIIVLIVANLKIQKNKRLYKLSRRDLDYINNRGIIEEDAIQQILKDMSFQIIQLKSNLELKEISKESSILNYLSHDIHSIEAIINNELLVENKQQDLKTEIQKLIDDVLMAKKAKIKLVFEPKETQYIYDNRKLLSALRQIILISLENSKEKNINIIVNNKNTIFSNSTLEIKIGNMNLTADELEKTIKFLNLDKINPEIVDSAIDSRFLIARQNLLNIADKIYFDKVGNQDILVINLTLKKVREKKKKYKALVVDDDKATARLNQEVLKSINIESDILFSGKECIEKISKCYEDYDIIITDNIMPNMDGTELIRELKKLPGFDLPIIIVSGDSNEDNKFIEYYGFDGYIQKPLTKDKISKLIKNILK